VWTVKVVIMMNCTRALPINDYLNFGNHGILDFVITYQKDTGGCVIDYEIAD